MASKTGDKQLATELTSLLEDSFPGISIEVDEHHPRWQRRCLVFRWEGFNELLPEERFHRLLQVIPEEYRTKKLIGAVWLELGPKETLEEFLQSPRSEDVADAEPDLYRKLIKGNVFGTLDVSMGSSPEGTCTGDFSKTLGILRGNSFSREQIRDARLVFIRHGAYCDCQVLTTAQPALARLHAGAA